MSEWDERYRRGEHVATEPSRLVVGLDHLLPRSGRALDVAGGAGRHAVWLAARGLAVTLCDVAPTALALTRAVADGAGVSLETIAMDLEKEPLPAGPWDLVLSFHYLQRSLFSEWPRVLAPGGVLVFVQPTVRNLERHLRPSARFLVGEGEVPRLVQGLVIERYEEGWLAEGRHEALLVARKP